MAKQRKRSTRIPKLSYSDNRGIGWFVSYRDPQTGVSKKHRFGNNLTKTEAQEAYYAWLSSHVSGKPVAKPSAAKSVTPSVQLDRVAAQIRKGSLIEVTTGMLAYDTKRIRDPHTARFKGSILQKQFDSIYQLAHYFLNFLNKQHGQGAVARMTLADLTMEDVEAYNLHLVQTDYSESQVRKRMQIVQSIVNRAGRPEHGRQMLGWNWDARDVFHGRPDKPVTLPTVQHLQLILKKTNEQRTAMIWMAIGLGFGQSDLAKSRPEHFDADNYDMRRGKTGIERYGQMPPLVWACLERYRKVCPRKKGDLLFLTEDNHPLVHGQSDSVVAWWSYTRENLKDEQGKPANAGLNGFYSLRHTGATEFGSRPGCSLAAMRGWLGHSISSVIADRYMKPVSPENKDLIAWVRKSLTQTDPESVLK